MTMKTLEKHATHRYKHVSIRITKIGATVKKL
jgi:hypothetical protein